jgi:hypothetical protein
MPVQGLAGMMVNHEPVEAVTNRDVDEVGANRTGVEALELEEENADAGMGQAGEHE